MSKIARVEIFQVDLAPKVVRSDAIQAFTKQETPIVRIWTDDGADGTGYSYTIGTGGSAVVALLRDNMAPWLLGRDPEAVARARNRAKHTWPPIVGFTVGCGLGAAGEAAIGLWSLALPAGLALLAFALGFSVKLDGGKR